MKTSYIIVLVLGVLLSFQSCNSHEPTDEDGAEQCALDFAESFFSFDYDKAFQHSDSTSNQWLKMFVSNIKESDVDSIHQLTIRPTIKLEDIQGDDSSAVAICKVKNVFVLDTIGRPGHLLSEGVYKITLVRQNSSWKVRTAVLQQNGK